MGRTNVAGTVGRVPAGGTTRCQASAIGDPEKAEWLVVFPLITEEETKVPYLLLAGALDAGTLEITEVGSGWCPRGKGIYRVLSGQVLGAELTDVDLLTHWRTVPRRRR